MGSSCSPALNWGFGIGPSCSIALNGAVRMCHTCSPFVYNNNGGFRMGSSCSNYIKWRTYNETFVQSLYKMDDLELGLRVIPVYIKWRI